MKVLSAIIAALAVAAFLAVAVMPAVSQDTRPSSGVSTLAELFNSQAFVLAIKSGTATDASATFTVPCGARTFDIDDMSLAIVATYKKPLQGSYNMTNGKGLISATEALPANAVIDHLETASIPVTGTNAVIALQDMKLISMDGGKFSVEFGKLSFYLPNGYRNTYTLDRPVRISFSPDKMLLTIDDDSMVATTMSILIKPENTFPSDAKPVLINDVLTAYTG
jgi:hypothetical protein